MTDRYFLRAGPACKVVLWRGWSDQDISITLSAFGWVKLLHPLSDLFQVKWVLCFFWCTRLHSFVWWEHAERSGARRNWYHCMSLTLGWSKSSGLPLDLEVPVPMEPPGCISDPVWGLCEVRVQTPEGCHCIVCHTSCRNYWGLFFFLTAAINC